MLPTRSGRPQHFTSQGNAAVPVVIILVALSLSAAVFFLYTRKKIAPENAEVTNVVKNEAATVAPTPVVPVPAPVVPAKPPVFGFARPADLGAQLMRSLEAGDTETAAKLIATSQPEQEAMTKAVFEKIKELGYKTASVDQLLVVGQSGNAVRLSIPLLKADGTSTNARLLIDVQKDPQMGWKVSALRLPKELETALAAIPANAENVPAGTAQTSMAKSLILVESTPDALTFASDFVQALLKPDYETARKLVNEERVPSVKLAALCMVFEDGQYKLQANRPLMATVSTETTSWIIAKVQSSQRNEQTEFGIEMEKSTAGWSVIGLNLSQLLSDNAKPSTTAGVPYTPLVKNPKGGESIALYFEYDSNVLNPRAKKQLEIVAEILKASPAKKLRIGGHTDALGSDYYNVDLSQKRAEAVKEFFLTYGVPAAQVETVAFGKANPLSPNVNEDGTDNPEGRSRNRRAEILLDF